MGGTSAKQVEANRRNAKKSTGPRTEEGKRRSRRNGLRHGLEAAVVVPEGEREAYERAIARWEREAGPDNVVEGDLIRRAAAASLRWERIERANEQARERAAREAVGRWERRMRAKARKAGQRLMLDPVGVVEELEATAFGCDWMIRRWRALEAALRQGRSWGRGEVQSAQALLGLPVMVPGPCGDPSSRRLWGLAARSNPSGVEEPPPSPSGDQDGWPRRPGEAWAALRDFVAEQVDRLIGLRDEAWEEVEGPECTALARLAAAADVSPEGQLRHRYEVSADRSCNAAIRLFLNVRDRRRRELLAIAKEAAEIGDTPRAPVGGGWWREADSDPAPPGFNRVASTPAVPRQGAGPSPEPRPSSTAPVAAPVLPDAGSPGSPMPDQSGAMPRDGSAERANPTEPPADPSAQAPRPTGEGASQSGLTADRPGSDPEPEPPAMTRARPRVRGSKAHLQPSPTDATRDGTAPDRLPTPGTTPTLPMPSGRPDGRPSPDAPRRSEPISSSAPPAKFDANSFLINHFGFGHLARPVGDDRRTDPFPTPIGAPGSAPPPGDPASRPGSARPEPPGHDAPMRTRRSAVEAG